MSCATKIPVDATLQAHFRSGLSTTRYFVVRVQNEVCVEVASHPASASLQSDWNTIASTVGDVAAYILIRTGDEKSWMTITYVPTGTKIKDKMVYAATKSTLLEALGFQYFCGELHANDKDELSWAFYQGTLRPTDAYSETERARMEMDAQEEEERKWRIQQQQERQSGASPAAAAAAAGRGRGAPRGRGRGASPSPAASASASASSSLSPAASASPARPVSGIGGFHAVDVPFDASAEASVQQYQAGSANWVEFKINDSKDKVIGVKAISTSGAASLSAHVSRDEPRFYLYKHQAKNMLIYCCPGASARPLRMVYSTAKGSVADQCTALGVTISKSLEVTDPAEVNESLFRDIPVASTGYSSTTSASSEPPWASQRGRGRGAGAGGETTTARSRPLSVVSGDNPHPIYSMMGANPTRAGKKIVIPPKEAW